MTPDAGPALVLKLGGSLAQGHTLTGLLDIVAGATAPLVIVPGGGPFADVVRAIQPRLHLSDELCHRLALLSMHQMGLVIASHHARFVSVETLSGIASAVATGVIPVWLPFALQHHDATLPASWSVTSDTLAARLAERLGCGPVALVKSCAIARGATLAELTAGGVVDPVFSQVVVRARLTWVVYGAGDESLLVGRLGTATT